MEWNDSNLMQELDSENIDIRCRVYIVTRQLYDACTRSPISQGKREKLQTPRSKSFPMTLGEMPRKEEKYFHPWELTKIIVIPLDVGDDPIDIVIPIETIDI
jgi:hypothetical protein